MSSLNVESKINLDPEKLLSEDEAVSILGLSDRKNPHGALRWLCRMRRVAYIDVARGVRRFRITDLRAFIDKQRVEAQ